MCICERGTVVNTTELNASNSLLFVIEFKCLVEEQVELVLHPQVKHLGLVCLSVNTRHGEIEISNVANDQSEASSY